MLVYYFAESDSSSKNENSVNYNCRCFLMKSKSSLTLHRQQCNWNVPRPRNIVRTSGKQSMWHPWFNQNFKTLREYILCTKKTKITTLFNNSSPPNHVFCHYQCTKSVFVFFFSVWFECCRFMASISISGDCFHRTLCCELIKHSACQWTTLKKYFLLIKHWHEAAIFLKYWSVCSEYDLKMYWTHESVVNLEVVFMSWSCSL